MDNRFADVIVEIPKGDSNEYSWDERSRSVRFVRRWQANGCAAFEEGRMADTLAANGEPLPALLAITHPTFPGCRVNVRVIGALEQVEAESTDYRIIAVAQGDPDLAHVHSVDFLSERERQVIKDSLLRGSKWLDEEEASQLIRHARDRARLSRVGQPGTGVRLRPWEAAALEKASDRFDEKSHFTWAEYALSTLPLRFQSYVRELLFPSERILLWVYRPLMTRGGVGIFRRRILRAGLAILTDRQFLWMVDPMTPNLNLEGYGYVVRVFGLERLGRALVELENPGHRLLLSAHNGRGETEEFSIEFPDEAEAEINEMAKRLNGFTPRTDEKRPVRVNTPEPSKSALRDPMTKDAARTEATVQRLQERFRQVAGSETVFAEAFVPEWGEGGAQLLTVTDRAVYWVPESPPRGKTAGGVRIPLETIGTVELCNSQLDAWFRVWLPTGRKLDEWTLTFPPVMSPAFTRCLLVLRDLLSSPGARQ